MKTIKFLLVFICSVAVAACGGGGTTQAHAPTIEYAKTVSVADGTMADYMNADWLYQNYLGEYGLPAEVKPLFLPELQMLANGFALQYKRGEDVKTSITQLHQGLMMLNASGQLAQFFAQVNQNPAAFAKLATEQGGSLREPPATSEYKHPVFSAEELAAMEKSRLHMEQGAAKWERVRKEYNLPYELPDRIEKWFTYSPAMKGSKNPRKDPPPALPPAPPNLNLSSWDWVHGDFVYLEGGNPFGHVAIVDMWNLPRTAIEAQTDSGVRRVSNLDAWAKNYSYAEGRRMRLIWNPVQIWVPYIKCNNLGVCFSAPYLDYDAETQKRMYAINDAAIKIGQPYNWNFWNKQSSANTYCSQLVWQSYFWQGMDLDADGGPVVFPSDLRRSAYAWVFKTS
jgi:hypothetical protein